MTDRTPAPPPAAPQAARVASPSDADRVRSRLMLASLRALLDQARGSREVLPHLATLEAMLGKQGVGAIPSIEPRLLSKICSQLSSLPMPKDDAPLLDLLTRLLDAMDLHHLPHQPLSTFVNDSKLMVMESSHTDFMAASFEQATTQLGEP
jgi:hypothetical protein